MSASREELKERLENLYRRAKNAESEIAHWKTVTGFDDPESLDFYLGRIPIRKHAEVQAEIIAKLSQPKEDK